MLGKTFYSPNLTILFYFSAPNIKISDQKYAKMNCPSKLKIKAEEAKSRKIPLKVKINYVSLTF